MACKDIAIVVNGTASRMGDEERVGRAELKRWVTSGQLRQKLFHYRHGRYRVPRMYAVPAPFLTMTLLHGLTRGHCEIVDDAGQSRRVKVRDLGRLAMAFVVDKMTARSTLETVAADVTALELLQRRSASLQLDASPLYLRTDLTFGLTSGGSVGHIAGVLNNLDRFCGIPYFMTTDVIPTVRLDIPVTVVPPGIRFWDDAELPSFDYNRVLLAELSRAWVQPAFVYQRYSLNNYVGVTLATRHTVPFVLEYNGSEVWISRNWGRQLRHEALSERIELLNLRAADLVVVVSSAMRDELVTRGIDETKILVNPNGVDPELYSPEILGDIVRRRYGLQGKRVVGFIGTFGAWHGAEVLVAAVGALLERRPEWRADVRLLLVGDGVRMPAVRNAVQSLGLEEVCTITGNVPQAQGPQHLAACDVLASPHIPNSDGTPFFGSPTKLFEYMAMGRAIVASDLDQIGEVLSDDVTAVLVKPGDADALSRGLEIVLSDESLRARLGEAARSETLARYTWHDHTARIVSTLQDLCA